MTSHPAPPSAAVDDPRSAPCHRTRPGTRSAVGAAAVAFALAVAGCGGSDDAAAPSSTTTTATKTLTTAEQAEAERRELARVEDRKIRRENVARTKRLRGPVRRAVGAELFVSVRAARYVVVRTRLRKNPELAFSLRVARAIQAVEPDAIVELRGVGGKQLALLR